MSFTRLPPLRALLAGGYENAERDQTQTAPAPLWLRLLPDILNDGARATRAQLSSYRGEQMPQVMLAHLAMVGFRVVEAGGAPISFRVVECGFKRCSRLVLQSRR